MALGAFSVSLAVEDLAASREFYALLGFEPFAGDGESWQMLRNGDAVIGLFQGMFEENILTFNPGWTGAGEPVDGGFEDVRSIRERLVEAGVELTTDTEPDGTGPAHIAFLDPDGNAVLVDQHVDAPEA